MRIVLEENLITIVAGAVVFLFTFVKLITCTRNRKLNSKVKDAYDLIYTELKEQLDRNEKTGIAPSQINSRYFPNYDNIEFKKKVFPIVSSPLHSPVQTISESRQEDRLLL